MHRCGSRSLILGLNYHTVIDLDTAIQYATAAGVALIVAPVKERDIPSLGSSAATGLMTGASGSTNCESTRRDRWPRKTPNKDTWATYVVVKLNVDMGHISPMWDDEPIVDRGKQVIDIITYLKDLGAHAVMIKLPDSENTDLPEVLGAVANSPNPIQIWIQVTMESGPIERNNFTPRKGRLYNKPDSIPEEESNKSGGEPNSWYCWSTLHEKVDFNKNVRVVLRLPLLLPNEEIIKRWLAEPVAAVVIPAYLFFNQSGMPVLAFKYQRLLVHFVTRTNAIVIIESGHHYSLHACAAYLRRVWNRRSVPLGDEMYNHAEGWADQVQLPLQPLHEDLEVRSYMLLEKDSVKYNLYKKAIIDVLRLKKGLKDMEIKHRTPCHIDFDDDLMSYELYLKSGGKKIYKDESQLGLIRVAVLGAGRGPLVSIVLNAAEALNASVKVYAIEKNDAAASALEFRKTCDWIGHDVEVLREDFRTSTISPKCDIAIYELLGSWGDNELAPECIDGAINILRHDCVYIPTNYTSYVAPTSSSKVWAAAKAGGINALFRDDDKHLETIWVSYMKNKKDLGEPQAVFTFEHSSYPMQENLVANMDGDGVPKVLLPKVDRSRYRALTWTINMDSVMHGFAGYFHCNLFNNKHEFNTLPRTHTEGLITWFPVFIPLKKPMRLSKGCKLKAEFWRCTVADRVWYEWMASTEDGNNSGIHNKNGTSSVMYTSM